VISRDTASASEPSSNDSGSRSSDSDGDGRDVCVNKLSRCGSSSTCVLIAGVVI
jgi:hypothetical protein